MATLYITEYSAYDLAPFEPPVAEQTVAIGVAAAASKPFNKNTVLVRLHTDNICSTLFSHDGTPATTSNQRMIAGQTTDKIVPKGQGLMVSVIANR